MKILLGNITAISGPIQVTAELLRPDLVIQEIIEEKGVDFVLGAIGEKAIQIYMEANGYVVVDIEKTVKAA
jgi:hypothetical protein